jgi:TolA-binding protein
VDANLNNGGEYVEETYYWQGKVLAAQGDTTNAAAAFRRALSHNPSYTAAADALKGLST